MCFICVGNTNVFAQNKLQSLYQKYSKKDINLIILPSADYSPETGLRLGVFADYYYKLGGKYDSITKQSITWVEAQYSFKNQLFTQLYSSTFTKNNNYYILSRAGYVNNLEKYWGYSYPNASAKNFANIEYMKTYINLKLTKRIYEHIYTGFNANYTQYSDGREVKTNVVDEALLNINASNIGAGISCTYDSRNSQIGSTSGGYFDVSTTNHYDIKNKQKGFGTVTLDGRYFYSRKKHLFAHQAYLMHSYNDAPLFEKAKVGGISMLRGYFQGRYRDDDMWCLQTEYRYLFHPLFKIVYFASIGATANDLNQLFTNQLLASNGLGLRLQINKKKNVYMRFDGAIAKDGSTGFYIKMGEAF
jgi:hypothetical protein